MFLDGLLKLYNAHSGMINRVSLTIIIGFIVLFVITRITKRWLKNKLLPQSLLVLQKVINYGGFVIVLLVVMQQLDIRLSAFFGAAGVAAIAISFAAQNSLSNIISGLFLLWEKPFQIGDLIEVENKSGIVFSMDLLSVNLRTFDNRLIRIPNEQVMKANFTNITRFPIRRLDLNIGISYNDDVDQVFNILKDIAVKNPYCLDEPEPVLIFKGFMDSSQDILFGIWFEKTDYMVLRNSILKEIKRKFDEEGIEIPFPHRTLYTGSSTEPFPLTMVTHQQVKEAENNDKPDDD